MWEFQIDVGGTFTDCIGYSPLQELHSCKILSSGVTQGIVRKVFSSNCFQGEIDTHISKDFWRDYHIRFFNLQGACIAKTSINHSDPESGKFEIDNHTEVTLKNGSRYEIFSSQPAPVLAIRRILQLPLSYSIPAVDLKLGTTRGTNALLTRTGAQTALVTTRGFADALLIANQDREHLFQLNVKKAAPLFSQVVEIDERIAADGKVIRPPDLKLAHRDLKSLFETGIESIAICLLHSYQNSLHEEQILKISQEIGFTEISLSSQLSPLIKLIPRGDTTVVNAYLNPVLKDYIQDLRQSLPHSRIRMMTSSGGLVSADHFTGKESVLSGPAGGVIGVSNVAQQAGFQKAIGFDMGGTSTDVSRFDGKFEYDYETKKADVRISSPMMAIETVAAGGGSICRFDGVRLAVGPESAGADPGPACYGRNGPLTVTDMNLFLGRIQPQQFPFPLDSAVVGQKLEQLRGQISLSPLGQNYSARELAEGFIKIANANMARAIRRISVAKGYLPDNYVLATFGGAGAQHACAVARELNISQILIHPLSGILSAYGIGMADVRRFREQSILKILTTELNRQLESIFEFLSNAAIEEVIQEGVDSADVLQPVCTVEMRYAGMESTLHIESTPLHSYADDFENSFEERYGYLHPHRAIEVVNVRVEVVGRMPHRNMKSIPKQRRSVQPDDTVSVVFSGKELNTNLYLKTELNPGDTFLGPAIIIDSSSTVIVEPEFQAEILNCGEVLLVDQSRRATSNQSLPSDRIQQRNKQETNADPVMLELFNNQFASIAEQMGETLQRTSVSTNVKDRRDFSCAIFSPEGNLVVNAPHIPVHLGAMSETVKSILKKFPSCNPGDVFISNDPYAGGSHLPDVTVVSPVHAVETGEILFITASRSHHAEIGGMVPGSMPPFSYNLAEEGVLIRHFKLIDAGISQELELKKLLLSGKYPTRSVDDNLADITAQVAANRIGLNLLIEMMNRHSQTVVQAYMNHIQRAAAAKMKLSIQKLEDGVYKFQDHLDDQTPIAVTITVAGEQAIVDFSGTGHVSSSNLNANRAITTSAVMYVFRCLIDEEIPLNSGMLEPIEIIIPPGILNPPAYSDPHKCPAMVGGNVETSQRIVDVLLGALNLAAASQGTMNNLTFGNEHFGYYETICGGSGATATANGCNAIHTHMTNTRLTDVETIEQKYPVRVHEFSIRKNSGGIGLHSGGEGIIRKLEFLEPMHVSLLTERRGKFPPFGLLGGKPGAIGQNKIMRKGSNAEQILNGKAAITVEPGDMLTIITPGGGGYGEAPLSDD